jgi:protein-tyrosine phosphatase
VISEHSLDILIVCTANRCRSPMAEALLGRRLDARRVVANVGSAGFLESGAPAMEYAIATMADEGLDIAGHRSRQVTPDMLAAADLVIAMTRQHVIELAVMSPDAWPRLFRATELVRLAEAAGPRPADLAFGAWLDQMGAGRTRAGLMAAQGAEDVADPVGQPKRAYDRTKVILDDLMTRLAGLL